MKVRLESGKIYFYQSENDTSAFMCLEPTVLNSSNTFFNAFIFIQQSVNENLDGWNGFQKLGMNSDQANDLGDIDSAIDWLSSNDFSTGTPKQQLIKSCFEAIY